MICRISVCASVTASCLGIAALCAGIVILSFIPSIVRRQVEDAVVLKPDGEAVKKWGAPPVKASIQFWLFNVTNPNEVIFQGAKPALFQKGPYGFRERLRKENITFSSDNTVSFTAYKDYFFLPELSCETCRLDDVFTVPNIPYFTVMKLIRSQGAAKGVLDFLGGILLRLVGEHPFVSNVTAGQLLFEGYDDQILKLVNQFKPGLLPQKVGLFYGRNGSGDGPYQIRTGSNDISKLGDIVSWQGLHDLTSLGWWNPNYTDASMINGTDGGIYPPFLTKTDLLPVFSRELCRSLSLRYHSNVDIGGLLARRFRPPPDVFDSSSEANRGFCWPSDERYYGENIQPKLDGGWCLPTGMLDVSKCYNNAQIVMTSPQFLFCPDEVIESVGGLFPPSDEFVTAIDIEPTTGVVVSASKKLQLNIEMYADSSKPQVFKKMKAVIVPIVWLNESIVLDDETRNVLYQKVVVSQRTAHIGAYVAIGIGALVGILGVIALIVLKARKRKNAVGDMFQPATQQIDPSEANSGAGFT